MKKNILILSLIVLFASCKTSREITYLQNAGKAAVMQDTAQAPVPDALIKKGDLLTITVNASTPEAAQPFNLPLIPTTGIKNYDQGNSAVSTGMGAGSLQNYLIDVHGDLIFPVIGKIHAEGMTKTQLTDYIVKKIYPRYIKEEPIISIRFANFKVSVLGEVARPNTYNIDNEKISLLEAIAMAGDLTIFGKRDNVLLIRENNGKRETVRLDLRDKRLIDSPYYFLQQNDVIYVQPNGPKARSSAFGTAETVSISIVGTLISLSSLIITLLK